MTSLAELIPHPRLVEVDHVDVSASIARAWAAARNLDIARSQVARLLLTLRTLPERLAGRAPKVSRLQLEDLAPGDCPGFRILSEQPGREVVVGAIGKVWRMNIPFVDIKTADEFRDFDDEGYIKVAWALRVQSRGQRESRVELELRVTATDEESWRRFHRYYRVVGLGSRIIRRQAMEMIARDLGAPKEVEGGRSLPGDERLPDARGQLTHARTIRATPEQIWPWLVQMGRGRAGWYSYDLLDNGGERSAEGIRPELQRIAVGDVLPASSDGKLGFEVLELDVDRSLVLGGLFDRARDAQLPFDAERPGRYWHVTWTFVLEPLDDDSTRLIVRARAAFSSREWTRAAWIRVAHHIMQTAQLRRLAARVEGRHRASGLGSAVGDDLVPEPTSVSERSILIRATPEDAWPWLVQMGYHRAGWYIDAWWDAAAQKYFWPRFVPAEARGEFRPPLDHIDPSLQALGEGDIIPDGPPGSAWFTVERLEPPRILCLLSDTHVSYLTPKWLWNTRWRASGAFSWLFALDPVDDESTRLTLRMRACVQPRFIARALGPAFGVIDFVHVRRMLQGIKRRVEQARGSPASDRAARISRVS